MMLSYFRISIGQLCFPKSAHLLFLGQYRQPTLPFCVTGKEERECCDVTAKKISRTKFGGWILRIITAFGNFLSIYNMFADYPNKLTPQQKELFDKENPFWADFFKDREYKYDGGKNAE